MEENFSEIIERFTTICRGIVEQNHLLFDRTFATDFDPGIELDNTRNNAGYMLTDFFDILKAFGHGNVPTEMTDEVTKSTDMLSDRLHDYYAGEPELAECFTKIGLAFRSSKRIWRIRDPVNQLPQDRYEQLLDVALHKILTTLDNFILTLNTRTLPPNRPAADEKPATKKDVESIVKTAAKSTDEKLDVMMVGQSETAAVMNRIDSRTKKIAKERKSTARFSVAVQELCHTYWVKGQHLPEIKANCRGKVSHKAVFEYFKRELSQHGIKTAADFHAALDLRSKRISKQTDAN